MSNENKEAKRDRVTYATDEGKVTETKPNEGTPDYPGGEWPHVETKESPQK